MTDDTKVRLHDLSAEMNRLCEEAAKLCASEEPSQRRNSLSATLFNLQRYIDFVWAVSSNEPPGDLVVQVDVPGADNEVYLDASWNKAANGFRLKSVPINLAAVARTIDSELADHKHTGMVSFSWNAIPVELAGIVR